LTGGYLQFDRNGQIQIQIAFLKFFMNKDGRIGFEIDLRPFEPPHRFTFSWWELFLFVRSILTLNWAQELHAVDYCKDSAYEVTERYYEGLSGAGCRPVRRNQENEEWRAGCEADAFRHAWWSYCLTERLGHPKGWEWVWAHEEFPGNREFEKRMDLYNNSVGVLLYINPSSIFERPVSGNQSGADLVRMSIRENKLFIPQHSRDLAPDPLLPTPTFARGRHPSLSFR
ncbi:unnamed protein product, partial [marine sediment metagenome]